MRTIKITDTTVSKIIEDTRGEEHDQTNIKPHIIEKIVKKTDEQEQLHNDQKYQNMFKFPSKYHYFIFLIMFQNSNEMTSIAVRHALTFSGGGFLLQLIAVGVLIVFPLMYVELFLGSYAQRTNSQIYKMAPIFFGVTFFIWIYTVFVLLIPSAEETLVLVHFIKRLSREVNETCPPKGDTCYDFSRQPRLSNGSCSYKYVSMECASGEVRYLSEYQYWNLYKRIDTANFPLWEIVVSVITQWAFIAFFLTRGLKVLVKMHNFGFIYRTVIFTIILVTATTNDGCSTGLQRVFSVSTENMTLNEALGMLAFVMFRCGLIFPVGLMTYSSCLPQRKSMRFESVVIGTGSLILTIFNLMCVFGVMGVIGDHAGVDLSAIFVARGIFLAVMPEFLLYHNNATVFAVCYYFSLLFPEIVRYAIHIHMWIINLYDFIPKYRRNHVQVCLVVCGFFCLLSMISAYQPLHTIVIPAFYSVHTTIGTMIYLALEMTVICYVYGVNRLTDDIHFLVGYKPNKSGQYVWAIFPIALYISFIFLRFRNERISIERDLPPERDAEYVVAIMNNVQIIMIAIAVLLSVAYIFSKTGADNTFLNLFKPHYLWGPEERSDRIKRKHFMPRKAIRSQPALMRVTKVQGKRGKFAAKQPGQEELEEQKGQIQRSRIFSDSQFFASIGIPPDKLTDFTQKGADTIMVLKDELD